MSKNYFGTNPDQAPRNSELGDMAYWDMRQAFDLMNGIPKRITSNYTAKSFESLGLDTTDGPFTVTLPSNPSINDRIRFFDYQATWDVENPIVSGNGNLIMGLNEDMEIDILGGNFTLVFIGNDMGWVRV